MKSSEENGGCCGLSAVDDARRVAERIGIPYYVMNFREVFREKVIDNFVSEYEKGQDTESMYCLQSLCQMGSTA